MEAQINTTVTPLEYIRPQVFELSILDQAIKRMYGTGTQLFKLDPSVNIHDVYQTFYRGTQALMCQIPMMCARLRIKDPKTGYLHAVVDPNPTVQLNFKNFTSYQGGDPSQWRHGSFADLEAKNFPMTAMHDSILHPKLPETQDDFPTFLGQLTFIDGGMIFMWGGCHTVGDARVIFVCLKLWAECVAAASRGETLETSPVSEDSYDRSQTNQAAELPEMLIQMAHTSDEDATPPAAEIVCSYWKLSADKLNTLKAESSPPPSEGYISGTDAITSLFWRSISKARRLKERGFDSTALIIAQDAGQKMDPPLPMTYFGCASIINTFTLPLEEVVEDTPTVQRELATQVRQSIREFDAPAAFAMMVGVVKSFKSLNDRPSKRSTVHLGPNVLHADQSSMDEYSLHWGEQLGHPVIIRQPYIAYEPPTDGTVNVRPKFRDGGQEVCTYLERSVLERMKKDPILTRHFEYMDEITMSYAAAKAKL